MDFPSDNGCRMNQQKQYGNFLNNTMYSIVQKMFERIPF